MDSLSGGKMLNWCLHRVVTSCIKIYKNNKKYINYVKCHCFKTVTWVIPRKNKEMYWNSMCVDFLRYSTLVTYWLQCLRMLFELCMTWGWANVPRFYNIFSFSTEKKNRRMTVIQRHIRLDSSWFHVSAELSGFRTVDTTHYRTDNSRFTCRTSCHYAGPKVKESSKLRAILLYSTWRRPQKYVAKHDMPLKCAHEFIVDFCPLKARRQTVSVYVAAIR